MQTLIKVPEKIKDFLKNDTTPLIEKDGVLWYSITREEKELLSAFVKEIDSVPEDIWRTWSESDVLELSFLGNSAHRIIKNCIIKN